MVLVQPTRCMLRQHLQEQTCQFLTKLVSFSPSIIAVAALHSQSLGLYSACHPHELRRHYIIIIVIIIIINTSKSRDQPRTGQEGREGSRKQLCSFFNLVARCGVWSTSRSGRFTPGKDPVTFAYEAGWAARSVRTGAKNLAPHRNSITGPSSP